MISGISLSEHIYLDKEIQGCELAVTDKAKCILCERIITQGTPRLWVFGELKQAPPDEGIVKIKRFICNNCAMNTIGSKEKEYQQEIKRGEVAKVRLTNQNKVKLTYLNYLKKEEVALKIRNGEILQELEESERDDRY